MPAEVETMYIRDTAERFETQPQTCGCQDCAGLGVFFQVHCPSEYWQHEHHQGLQISSMLQALTVYSYAIVHLKMPQQV